MSASGVLGTILGGGALLMAAGAVALGVADRRRRRHAGWMAVLAAGFGLFALSVALDFRSVPLAVSALGLVLVGAVGTTVEAVRALRAQRSGP